MDYEIISAPRAALPPKHDITVSTWHRKQLCSKNEVSPSIHEPYLASQMYFPAYTATNDPLIHPFTNLFKNPPIHLQPVTDLS